MDIAIVYTLQARTMRARVQIAKHKEVIWQVSTLQQRMLILNQLPLRAGLGLEVRMPVERGRGPGQMGLIGPIHIGLKVMIKVKVSPAVDHKTA